MYFHTSWATPRLQTLKTIQRSLEGSPFGSPSFIMKNVTVDSDPPSGFFIRSAFPLLRFRFARGLSLGCQFSLPACNVFRSASLSLRFPSDALDLEIMS